MLVFIFPPSFFDSLSAFHPYVEDREQFQRHINPTFSGPASKNRSDLYTRLRVGFDYRLNTRMTAKVEYQNADDLFWTRKGNDSSDSSDLSLAYLTYDISQLSLTAGRQKIILGQQRLIGPSEWLNLARSFDAGQARSGQWDVWGGKIGVANTEPQTARIAALTHFDKDWGTTSLIVKHDFVGEKNIDEQTFDHLVSRKFGSLKLDGEGAAQYGRTSGRTQNAWAWHLRATETVVPKTDLSVEANAASGGGDSDTSHTFDNLYPSNHDQYGLADMVGWKNMNDLAVKLSNNSIRSLTLRAEDHTFSLRDPSDGWYSATGVVNPRPGGSFVDPTGQSGRQVGQELDFEAIYQIRKNITTQAGISFFDPGDFVKNLSGHDNQVTFGYAQVQVRF